MDRKYNSEKEKNGIEHIKNMIPKLENVINTYSTNLSPEDRNNLLKGVINKVTYKKEVKGRGHEADFSLKIDLKL